MPKKEHHKESHAHHEKKSIFHSIEEFYIHKYRQLFFILVALTIFAIGAMVFTYFRTGDFLIRDVTLKGGISLTIHSSDADSKSLESYLVSRFPKSSINLRTIESGGSVVGMIIEASDISDTELVAAVTQKIPLQKSDYSVETMGSSLGESFFAEMFIALLIAFFSLGLVFLFYFKNIYATIAAIMSALLDIFITLGIMNLIGIRLTAGGIAAYLMLIGYSIDTSILLSTKLLKEQVSDVNKALFGALKTGLTMSFSGIAATGISFLLTNNTTLKQIMLILVVGLVVDIITTWIGNVSLLRFYLEGRKNVKA